MELPKYIKSETLFYKGHLPKVKKATSHLQPVFEAVTNSLEAIKIVKRDYGVTERGSITLNLYKEKTLLSEQGKAFTFKHLEVVDTGVGLDDSEFGRFLVLDDDRKGFHNKGTGRIQFLHAFDTTEIVSVYRDRTSSTGFRQRKLTLSKSKVFLNHNAIVRLEKGNEDEVDITVSSCCLKFSNVLNESEQGFYNDLTLEGLKESIINRYLANFCKNRNEMPDIILRLWVDGEFSEELLINDENIPVFDKEETFTVHYNRIEGKRIIPTDSSEVFTLTAFKIPASSLSKNELKLTSKGEVIGNDYIKLEGLLPKDEIDGKRYLFLISSSYIDSNDSDSRGEINLFRRSEVVTKQVGLFEKKELILLDDIESGTNSKILSLYDEIKLKVDDKWDNIKRLQKMFLLNPKTLETLRNSFNVNDSDDIILKKVYRADVDIVAKRDAEIKRYVEETSKLSPSDDDYQGMLTAQVDELVKVIPLQNRTALTHYVARRKLVLDLFGKVLKKQLDALAAGGRIDEDILHNLIFQQTSKNSEESDLWLIEEDFIYFKGVSETQLNLLEIDGEKVFKEEFTVEEKRYLNSLGERRLTRRPDILLFPDEGKCIIIEFKAPDVNVSKYLTQIDSYANLILNYTTDKFQIDTFYGYLIGEGIEDRDVRGNVSRFEQSYHFNYWFRPSEKVNGFDGTSDGSIYTEVLKYSTLLKRAVRRNEIFIDKLTKE